MLSLFMSMVFLDLGGGGGHILTMSSILHSHLDLFYMFIRAANVT